MFEASAPDGTQLRIIWFEVSEEQERSFEQYRRGLRRLMKSGTAAGHDVVARPGAHYVVWYVPQGSRGSNAEAEVPQGLQAAGLRPEQADARRHRRRTRPCGL